MPILSIYKIQSHFFFKLFLTKNNCGFRYEVSGKALTLQFKALDSTLNQ
jgi:hypothetical protein